MASSNGVPAGFADHDWENDAQWKRFLQGVELPARPAQEAAALRRLKQKYWLRHVDPSATFASESQPTSSAGTGTTGSTSEPSAQQSSGPSSSSSGNARTSSAGSTPSPQTTLAQLGPLGLADIAANAAVVLNALALILLGASAAYRWLLFAACATCAIHLYRTLGMPQFSREYLARLMAMESTHYLLLALIYMNESPVLLLVPVLTIYALTNTAAYVSSLVSGASGLGRYVRMGTAYVLGKREQLFFAAAYLEILLLPLVVIKFFQGYVGLMAVVVYWQFVAARYRSNARTRAVATSLLGQLDSLVYTYLPSSIGALYHRLRGGAPA